MSRPIDDAWFHRLKSATRDLVKLCGGVDRAGGTAGLSSSQMSRCQLSTDPTIITIPQALALEADCGQPLITGVMAEINGCKLTDGAAAPDQAGCLVASHSQVLSDVAKLVTQFATAAADGKFSPAEIETIDRARTEVLNSLNGLGQACATAKAGAGPRLVQRP